MLATAALLVTGSAFAGANCCDKEGKKCCKKESKAKPAKATAKRTATAKA